MSRTSSTVIAAQSNPAGAFVQFVRLLQEMFMGTPLYLVIKVAKESLAQRRPG
jgi:hypothetical protein